MFPLILLSVLLAGNTGERDWTKFPAVLQVDHAQVDNEADIYAIGDVHGDCERMSTLLKGAGLADGLKWTGGPATLVFLGDTIDKGPRMVETLQTIRALHISAAAQGGRVIALLGNHEAEFLSDSAAKKFADFSKDLKQHGTSAAETGQCRGELGEFLCRLPVAARVDDWFFSHGGNTGRRTIAQLNADLQQGIAKEGFATPQLSDPNSILEARLGDTGPGGKPWFDAALPGRNARQLLTDYAKALGVNHLMQGHQHNDVAFDDGVTRKIGEAFQRWGLLFLMDTGLSQDVNDSTGALLHISEKAKTASAVCANGKSATIWDQATHSQIGNAPACGS